MRKLAMWSAVLILTTATATAGQGLELKTEEQKTLYALGLAISRSLGPFNLSAADLEAVEAGLTDGSLHKAPKIELETYGPKIRQLQEARAALVAEAEKKASQAFLDQAAAEKGATKTASGLILITITPGTGASPKATDTVKVNYEGKLTDGTVFDSSVKRNEPLTLALTSVIKCWTEGVPMMKVGGKSKLVCPSDIAYGDQGRPPIIKPGATLVFEIELLEIVK